ncbi:MAG TPA: hypothetical protein DCM68_05055, partial [Verrucomicrobia bacterium]|nr:hypothetical protein [Verrucomicrobiota bacterium]
RSLALPMGPGRTYTNATLSFSYRRENWDATDSMTIRVSTNQFASQSNLVSTIDGRVGTDAAYTNVSANLAALLGANLALRIQAGPNFDNNDRINFDFVTITYSGYDIATNPATLYASNVQIVVVSNLAAGPTNLLENYSLAPGSNVSLRLRATLDVPLAATQFVNVATVTNAKSATRTAAVTNFSVAYSVGGRVWHDTNNNGIQDPTETNSFANVPVALMRTNGTVFQSVVTDAEGDYLSTNVVPGDYYALYDLTAFSTNDYLLSPANAGSDDALDSDATYGEIGDFAGTDDFTVSMGQTNLTIDVGFDPPEPTLVVLYSFTAGDESGQVVVRWRTASEENTVGFFVERLDSGQWVRVNHEIIYAKGEDGFGASYERVDSGAEAGGTYIYRLVEVETDGIGIHGPFERTATALEFVSPISSGPNGVLLRWLSRADEYYEILRSTNLIRGFELLELDIPATPPENEYLDTNPGPIGIYLIQMDDE